MLLRSRRNICKPINPLPDVSSTIRSGSPTAPRAVGNLARDNDDSAAIAHKSVSSGEKKAVKVNGGRNDRSLLASLNSEGSTTDGGDDLPC